MTEIDNILDELEELYDCQVKHRNDFVSNLFEISCEIAEHEGIKPSSSPNYINTLMCNYLSDMRDDIAEKRLRGDDSPLEVFINSYNIDKIAWQMYLDRK